MILADVSAADGHVRDHLGIGPLPGELRFLQSRLCGKHVGVYSKHVFAKLIEIVVRNRIVERAVDRRSFQVLDSDDGGQSPKRGRQFLLRRFEFRRKRSASTSSWT